MTEQALPGKKASTGTRIVRWFDPRGRTINTLVFMLNRITGLGLALYLFLHLIVLSQLANGPAGYEKFLETIHNPIFIFGEVLVVAAGFIHGLNGCRIALISFGIGTRNQRRMMIFLLAVAILCSAYFAVRMFAGL